MPQGIGRSRMGAHQVRMKLRRSATQRSGPAARAGAPHLQPGGSQGPEGEGCGHGPNPPSSSPGPALRAAAAAPSLLRAPGEATPPAPPTPPHRASRQMHTSLLLQCVPASQCLFLSSRNSDSTSNAGPRGEVSCCAGRAAAATAGPWRCREQHQLPENRRLLHLQQGSAATAAVKPWVAVAAEAGPRVAVAAEARPRVGVAAEGRPRCAGAPSGPRC